MYNEVKDRTGQVTWINTKALYQNHISIYSGFPDRSHAVNTEAKPRT